MKILSLAFVSLSSLAAVAATPIPPGKFQVWEDAGMRGASTNIASSIGECSTYLPDLDSRLTTAMGGYYQLYQNRCPILVLRL